MENEIVYIYKRVINDEAIEASTQNRYQNNLNDIESIRNPNDACSIFLEKFRTRYDKHFPLKKVELKTKDLKSLRITVGIKKSLKRKQRLYTKFLKNRNQKKMRQNIRTIKNFSNPSKNVQRNCIFQN